MRARSASRRASTMSLASAMKRKGGGLPTAPADIGGGSKTDIMSDRMVDLAFSERGLAELYDVLTGRAVRVDVAQPDSAPPRRSQPGRRRRRGAGQSRRGVRRAQPADGGRTRAQQRAKRTSAATA